MTENSKPRDMVDTTDCFEALTVFRTLKNLLFIAVMLTLIISHGIFWLDRTGFVDKTGLECPIGWHVCSQGRTGQNSCLFSSHRSQTGLKDCSGGGRLLIPLQAVDTDSSPQQAEKNDSQQIDAGQEQISAMSESGPDNSDESAAGDELPAGEQMSDDISSQAKIAAQSVMDQTDEEKLIETRQDADDDTEISGARKLPLLGSLSWQGVFYIIKVVNFVLIISMSLYSLTLLLSINISVTGRLGGLNHICRAFFASLFALVLTLPWQNFFPSIVAGAVYTPNELFCTSVLSGDAGMTVVAFYYLRFVVIPAAVIILVVVSQWRTHKWAQATLRRLGMKS